MDRRSMERLKLDKRLMRRRGWISKEDYEREIASLPDVSGKVAEPEHEPEGQEPPQEP